MSPLFRYTVFFGASVVLLLTGAGALLFVALHSGNPFGELNDEFFGPSQKHITKSQLILDQMSVSLYRQIRSTDADLGLPYRLQMDSYLTTLDGHLADLIRLRHEFDYTEAYELPSKSYRHFEAARQRLTSAQTVTEENLANLLDAFAPLRNGLSQLERVYEIDRQRLQDAQAEAAANYFRAVLLAAVALVLVVVPMITVLGIRLRQFMRRERRIRNDLEESRKNLEVMALYDSLTELANRHTFKARLEQAISTVKRSGHSSALMYIDLDYFKRINDSLGHDAGDEVLKVVGARLKDSVREIDTVARLGGDEFTIIVSELSSDENAGTIARKILDRIGEPMRIRGHEMAITASVGITVIPTDSSDPTTLMKNADMALYKAKESGRHTFVFFEEEMNRAVAEQTAMERDLRSAIRDERFDLHYQPQVALESGKVICMEALLSWTKADGTAIPPDHFISLAESSGLLPEIGDWVLRRACRYTAALHEQGASGLRMAVNLPARQFRNANLVSRIEQALLTAGLKPEFLEVEITETTLIENVDEAIDLSNALRRLGITVAIDDFGVGYSSLNYLKQLPVDALKIDRSFIRDIEVDEEDRSIVDTIMVMARNLSLRVTAEGIETEWQLRHLLDRQCGVGQGFLFSKPRPLDQLSISDLDVWCANLTDARQRKLRLIE